MCGSRVLGAPFRSTSSLPLPCPTSQGNVIRIETWWEGGQQKPKAGQAGQRSLLSQGPQQQQMSERQQQESMQGVQEQRRQDGGKEQQLRQVQEEPPLVNFLPHTQMPNFREPAETVLTAVRVTFARGLTQVSANSGIQCMQA